MNQADSALTDGDPDRASRLVEKVAALYHGPFLSEDPEPWIIPMQERLRSKFIRSVGKMGAFLGEKGEWDKAVEYYQKALEAENATEEFYQRLMICYQKLHRHTDALSTYHRCCKNSISPAGSQAICGNGVNLQEHAGKRQSLIPKGERTSCPP